MEGSDNTGNSNVSNGATDGNVAGTNSTTSLEGIMSNMADGQPEAKPGNGDNAEGSNNASQAKEIEAPAWTSQLSEDLRSNPDLIKQLSKFGKISDLAKSYSELETKLGKAIVKPGKDASDEEKESFYQQLGKPKSADKYSITDENAAAFRDVAFKNNLTDEQATALYAQFNEIGKNAIAQAQLQKAAKAKATDDALRAEWGNNYDSKITMLQRGVNTYGGKALGEKLKNSGLLFDADVIKMFVKLGEESADAGTAGRSAGGNGYIPTAEGGQFSWIEKQFKK